MSSGHSTPFPLLRSDHKILGSEYCSGYSDVFGKWNTGFYCPQSESRTAVSCCGTPTYKYCCTAKDPNEIEVEVAFAPYLIRAPVLIGIVGGVFLVLFLITLTSCYFCSCCFFYKKRRAHLPGSLYRMPLASSSTTSALVNTYSTSSTFSNNTLNPTTPLDNDWHQFQPNLICNNGRLPPRPNNLSSGNHLNNGNISTDFSNGFLSADILQQYLSAHNLQQQNQNNRPSNYSTLPRYFYHHQQQNNNNNTSQPRPLLSSGNIPTPPVRMTPQGVNVLPPPALPATNQQNRVPPPQSYIGYTVNAESRPYLISNNNFNNTSLPPVSERPRSVISLRNNVAYITSTLPLSNSFTMGRRTVHFRDSDIGNGPFRSNMSPAGGNLTSPNSLGETHLQRALSQPGAVRNGPPVNPPEYTESIPEESLKVTGGCMTTSGDGQGDMDLKLTCGSSSPPASSVGVKVGATGNKTTETGGILDKDLFTHPMTTSTSFGMGPEDAEKSVRMAGNQEENPPPPTSVLPSTPQHHQQQECQVANGNEEPEEPHYKVISSATPLTTSPPPSILKNGPKSNGKSTTISHVSNNSCRIPLIETHRVDL